MTIRVVECLEVTDAAAAFERLVPQLSTTNPPPTTDQLNEIVNSEASTLLLAVDAQECIVGALTLVMYRIPTGLRARIEDVVVDESVRGQGVGEMLSREALQRAKQAGVTTVDLTSRPSREAANRLYQRMGFVQRDSTTYRYEL